MKPLVCLACLLVTALSCFSETGISLTVYNQDLALVRDTRMMDYTKGTGEVSFRDVSAQIDPTSVHFQAMGVYLLEQNFDYDLISPEKLLQKYIDNQIEIVAKDGAITKGKLLSANTGNSAEYNSAGWENRYAKPSSSSSTTPQLVLHQENKSICSILLNNATEIRYSDLPEGLITKPTLKWLVKADSTGLKETEIAYLTKGISWQADYVLVLNDSVNQADVAAWVTLTNISGTAYKDATLKLVAGDINRVRNKVLMSSGISSVTNFIGSSEPQFKEKSLFEYHLYTLQRPTTVLNNQKKQISLLPNAMVPVKKLYEYNPFYKNDKINVFIEMENKEAIGLGIPLPAGKVRLYQKDSDGSQQFVGEDNIKHTPKNEKIKVRAGEAFDIAVERKQSDYRNVSKTERDIDYEVKLRNHKSGTVEITVVDNFHGEWRIKDSNADYEKINSNRVEFKVKAKPEKEFTLTYTVRTRY